jgi:hypothetical protein
MQSEDLKQLIISHGKKYLGNIDINTHPLVTLKEFRSYLCRKLHDKHQKDVPRGTFKKYTENILRENFLFDEYNTLDLLE